MVDSASVEAAVKAALDWSAAPEARQSATAFLDAIKYGDVRVLGTTALGMCKSEQPLEVRHYGLKLLQHLIRIRWDELNAEEKEKISRMVLEMVSEFAKPHEEWSLKSQTAALAAEVARREGPEVWKKMLQSLVAVSNMSPVHAEMVAMVLRWLPEDVIVHNEDLEGEQRRKLLLGLTQSLPELMPFMYKILERHFGAGLEAANQNRMDLAKQHAAAVTAALNAVLAYADWAPVTDFSNYGLIEACGYFLNSTEFRLTSCEILKQLVSRKKTADQASEPFNAVVSRVFEILATACEVYAQYLHAGGTDALEFAEFLCESMVALGSQNLQAIASNEQKLSVYHKQMLAFLQHPEFDIHSQALTLWLGLIRDALVPLIEKKPVGRTVPEETAASVMDVTFQRLLKQKDSSELEGEFCSAGEYSKYRGQLMEVIRQTSSLYPTLGITKVLQRLNVFLEKNTISSQDVSTLESTQSMLDAVVSGIVASPTSPGNELGNIIEDMLKRLLSVQWSEYALVELHAKFFDSFGPYFKHVPSAVPLVVQKLFQLLASVPIILKDEDPVSRKARTQVCTSFLRIAKAAGPAFLPHMQLIAETMTRLQQEHHLLRAEHILLGESLLVAGSTAGMEQQAQVLEWLLGPFRERWIQPEWQQKYLSSPAGLVELLSEVNNVPVNTVEDVIEKLSANQGMWYIYHSITFFEKALKRCVKEDRGSTQSDMHPMAAHMSWILPPLIQLLRCLHMFWSPSFMPTLPPALQQAMHLSVWEQSCLLGETMGNKAERKEDETRNWLRGIRDSGYNVLGFASTRLGDSFFTSMAGMTGIISTGLIESLPFMEFRHIRLFIHLVVQSLVKSCPHSLRAPWLGQLLPPLLIHCHTKLGLAWENLIKEGSPKTLTLIDMDNAGLTGLKTEVVEEKILRDLTREVCTLLATLASPELNPSQTLQHGMLFFIIQYPESALAALHMGILSLQWPDTEAAHRGAAFCGAIINMAEVMNDAQLREIVGKDMFNAILHSLTLESNISTHSELVGLLRDIVVKLSPYTPTPKQVLMSLPGISPQEFATFETAFKKTTSAKEQRQHIKSLLLVAGGDQLKALKPQKNTNVITNVTRAEGREKHKPQTDVPGPIGLATML